MSNIPTISTGEPSTLKTYRQIALILSGSENAAVVKYLDEKIASSPKGENEIVIAAESQMIYLIMSMIKEEKSGRLK